jgi:hypothetical protein
MVIFDRVVVVLELGHGIQRQQQDAPHQPPALIIIDLTCPQAFSHRPGLGDQHLQEKPAGRAASARQRDLHRPSCARDLRP